MIPYGRQSIDPTDIGAVARVLESDFLTTGPEVAAFEKALCNLTGARHAVACSNGTTALHLACMALRVGKGDLGITTPITFLASANCIEYCGGRTDFVDIDSASLCLSPDRLDEYCRTVAIPRVVIPVDFAGVPADLPRIHELGRRYGFRIIEDAAHAIGSVYTHEGREYQCGCCAHSDLAIFSFHPVKTITTGEGGAVMTNDDDLARRLRMLRSHGMTKEPEVMTRNDGPWYYEMHEQGNNYRITDMQCALGLSQLGKLPQFKARRQDIVRRYNDALKTNPDLILPPWPGNTSPCFHLYVIRFRQGQDRRRRAYDHLVENGISPQVHYIPVHTQPYYRTKYGYSEGKCPVAERYYEGCLSLPLYPGMTDEDVGRVLDVL